MKMLKNENGKRCLLFMFAMFFPSKSEIEFCKDKPEDVKFCTLRCVTGMP